jgi:outer membrane protein TolC
MRTRRRVTVRALHDAPKPLSKCKSLLWWTINLCLVTASLTRTPACCAADDLANDTTVENKAAQTAKEEVTFPKQKVPDENFLLGEVTARTTPHRMYSLKATFDKADKDNKQILIAASSLPIAQAAIVIAKAIPNPQFSTLYGWGNSFNYIIAGNPQQFGWSEEVQVLGKRTKKTEVASATYLQNALQLETTRFGVHNQVRRAYAELAAAHAYEDVIEVQADIAKKLLDISQKRFDAGKAPGSEVLQAKLSLMQFDPQRNQAWGRIVQDSAQMTLLLGEAPHLQEIIDVDPNGLFKLSAEKNDLIPDPKRVAPPLQQLLPVAWRERNDLKAAIQNAYVNKKALTLAKTQRVPDPVVGFQYFYTTYKPFQFGFFDPAGVLPYLQAIYPNEFQIFPTIRNPNPPAAMVESLYYQSLFSGAGVKSGLPIPNIAQDKVPFQPGYELVVQQENPIFYQYQGQINQAKGTWAQQIKQNNQLKAQIANDIVRAYENVLVTRANIFKFQDQILPVAARVSQLTRRGYELGKMDLATTILAQQQYQQLLSNYFDAVVAYQGAWADLEQAMGVPLNL